jgi:hypothetical protein
MKVVITHNNERTLGLLTQICEEQAGNVSAVHAGTFAQTLRAAFEQMADIPDEWFILVAGDQILLPGAVFKISMLTVKASPDIFRISGWGYDWLHRELRLMAPCAYRTAMIKNAIRFIDDKSLRPEYDVVASMYRIGKTYIIDNELMTAIHDCEQYYCDIYRKGYTQAIKNADYIKKNNLLNRPDITNDHKVFRFGIKDGMKQTPYRFDEIMKELGLTEKAPL